jgi:uncharacterized protein YndB with AHSA1/START domain
MTRDRTMTIKRVIAAPLATVWGAWVNPVSLPKWWGPDGYSCRTARIDLRTGGEWVFDMIGPDGTVFPNHHVYTLIQPQTRIDYLLLKGENGPRHAEARIDFEDLGGQTKITLCMTLATVEEYTQAMSFGAQTLGLQTLGKLARIVGAD